MYIKYNILILFLFIKFVWAPNKCKKTIIKSPKITYERDKDLIYSDGITRFYIEGKYKIKSKNVSFDRYNQIIFGNYETTVWDNAINIYNLKERFKLNLSNEILNSNKSTVIDKENNKYFFDDVVINLRSNEIVGSELKIEYEN